MIQNTPSAPPPLAPTASVVLTTNELPKDAPTKQRRCLTGPDADYPPDGPRAWSVAFGAFLAGLAVMGQLYSGGIFVVPLMEEFQSGLTETSLVVTMGLVMFYVVGLFATHLADYVGVRKTTFAGAIVWNLAWILGSFATQVWHSILTQGVLSGTGVALVYWPVIALLPAWFKKYRATAMGAAVFGSGVGSIIISFAGQQMIISIGWRNSLRVIGGMGAFLLIFAVLLVERRTPAKTSPRGIMHGLAVSIRDILRFPSARWFLASVLFFQFSFFVPYTFLPSYALSLGLSASFSGFALAMLGIGSAVGRLVFGPIADRFGRLGTYRVNVLLAATALGCWAACTTESSILAFAFFYGGFGGGFAAMFAVVAAELWGPERLSAIFTLVNLVAIPGAFASGPLIGAIVSATGGYGAAIGFTAAMMGAAFILVMIMRKPKAAHQPTGRAMEHLPASSAPQARTAEVQEGDVAGAHRDDGLTELLLVDKPSDHEVLAQLKEYDIDVEHLTGEERQNYIRAMQLTRFRKTLPDAPEDTFTRCVTALKENSFEALKQKCIERFGVLPPEWQYTEIDGKHESLV